MSSSKKDSTIMATNKVSWLQASGNMIGALPVHACSWWSWCQVRWQKTYTVSQCGFGRWLQSNYQMGWKTIHRNRPGLGLQNNANSICQCWTMLRNHSPNSNISWNLDNSMHHIQECPSNTEPRSSTPRKLPQLHRWTQKERSSSNKYAETSSS